MIIAFKNTLSDLRYFTETQVSDLLKRLTVSWLKPSGSQGQAYLSTCKWLNYIFFLKSWL